MSRVLRRGEAKKAFAILKGMADVRSDVLHASLCRKSRVHLYNTPTPAGIPRYGLSLSSIANYRWSVSLSNTSSAHTPTTHMCQCSDVATANVAYLLWHLWHDKWQDRVHAEGPTTSNRLTSCQIVIKDTECPDFKSFFDVVYTLYVDHAYTITRIKSVADCCIR